MYINMLKSLMALPFITAWGLHAENTVFDQPAVEVRINSTDLAPRINSVIEGEVTAVNAEAGVFSVSGRRVLFQSAREDAPPRLFIATVPLAYSPSRDPETFVENFPIALNVDQTMPRQAAGHPCACTRIIIQAPVVGNGGGAAANLQSNRQPAPILDYKMFPADKGMTIVTSYDFKQPLALNKDNVLHPIEDPEHAKRPWDTNCACDATLIIRPYGNDFTDYAESYSMPHSRTGEYVSYEKQPVTDPLPPDNPRDRLENVKVIAPATVRSLLKGDRVLVGISTGVVDQPIFVILAPSPPASVPAKTSR